MIDKITRPNGVVLRLRQIGNSRMDEIHHHPTFFQHFDAVIVDYSYVMSKDDNFLVTEAKWASQQNLLLLSCNRCFPKLALINNSVTAFNAEGYNELQELVNKSTI